jgi:hypothetical protein
VGQRLADFPDPEERLALLADSVAVLGVAASGVPAAAEPGQEPGVGQTSRSWPVRRRVTTWSVGAAVVAVIKLVVSGRKTRIGHGLRVPDGRGS